LQVAKPPAVPNDEQAEGSADAKPGSQVQQRIAVTANWYGPLPPPYILEQYNRSVEGGAERVFRQFEAEGEHRRNQEKLQLQATIRETRLGQWLAGVFAFAALAITLVALVLHAWTVATVVGGTTLVGVVGAFLYRQVRGNE
jgi:uncharacterized membrane protein